MAQPEFDYTGWDYGHEIIKPGKSYAQTDQDRERSLLMRWTNMRLNLQMEAKLPLGRAFFGFGGLKWDIHTLDCMISMSIPRFKSLGMGGESKFILKTFEGMLAEKRERATW